MLKLIKDFALVAGGCCIVFVGLIVYSVVWVVCCGVAGLLIAAYLWCLWHFTTLTLSCAVVILGLYFLHTRTTMFDDIL